MSEAREEPTVLRELREGVLLLTLNRPERLNATTPEMLRLYMMHVLEAAQDDAVKVIVVTGAGRGFCAGADNSMLSGFAQGSQRVVKLRRHWFTREVPKPMIAAVNGACVGVGFVIAMMCDMRIAGQSAKMGANFARLGLPAENAMDWVLLRNVGYARAFEILAGGRLHGGDALLRLGIANEVVADEELLAHTLAFARDVAANCSPRSLAIIKRQLQLAMESRVEEADALGNGIIAQAIASPDFREAMAARKEKRAPVFAPLGPAWWPENIEMTLPQEGQANPGDKP